MQMRQVGARLGLGLALLAPAGAVVGTVGLAGPAVAAAGTKCSSDPGTATISPGISNTPAIQTITIKAKLGGCTGSVKTGAQTGTLKSTTPLDCATLAGTSVSKGTFSIKWNTGATSKLTVSVSSSPSASTTTGKAASGLFKGGKVTGTTTATGANGDCTHTPITKETFTGNLAIS